MRGITFISLTSDPLRDTPAVFKAYTLKQGVDEPHWFFLTDDKAQMDLVLGCIGQIVPPPPSNTPPSRSSVTWRTSAGVKSVPMLRQPPLPSACSG